MNITHPTMWFADQVPDCTGPTWDELFQLRQKTFQGFAEIEEGKGVLVPKIPLHTAKAQDLIRLLAFRVLEEAVESYQAKSTPHIKEECIDAINYLMSIPLLDPETADLTSLATMLAGAVGSHFDGKGRMARPIYPGVISNLTVSLAGHLAEGLRNRSWMEHSQDLFYSRVTDLHFSISCCMLELLTPFENWVDFYRYWRSKDNVLQFRLRTRY